jgi:hypothetical protein
MFELVERDVVFELLDFYYKAVILDREVVRGLAMAVNLHVNISDGFNPVVKRALGKITNFYNPAEKVPSLFETYEIYKDLLEYSKKVGVK